MYQAQPPHTPLDRDGERPAMTICPREQAYEPLLGKHTDAEHLRAVPPYFKPSSPTTSWLTRNFIVPLWVSICFAILQVASISFLIWGNFPRNCDYPNAQILYSPAQDIVEYQAVKFHSGLLGGEAPDVYSSPPSDEVDAAWTNLYNFGISQIPEDQAVQLVNYTGKIPHSDSEYIVGLDVFHQLHCLDLLRKALHPDYYPPDPRESTKQREIHISHCVNSLRQSLQCSADISTIVFDKPAGSKETARFSILHSCRNFERIKEWGLSHRANMFKVD